MSKLKFELNRAGVRQLMQSEEMQSVLKGKANSALNSLGEGYKSDLHVGKNRANAMVYADTYQAKADNLRNNSILKAVR
ncbi:MAG TPA: hypothetical protein VFC73_08855 [Syntrophomonadaceae bacterium]|nr:hypothetical protein [Syntrophomonadaceae bacterium]